MALMEPPPTILVVDDDPLIRQLLAAVLGGIGQVELVEGGEEALQKVQSIKPDLIVLDVNLPDMNGHEVCQRLKENDDTSDTPVVFLTADNTNEGEEHALDVGATDFVRKPVSPKILTKRINNILSYQSAMRRLELLAATDPLTGTNNRRQFIEVGNAELQRSKRYKNPFTVLMLDIDHFKKVNDTYGHSVGDDALKETVASIQRALRTEDTLGRLGGEEFATIFPQTDASNAALVAERIREGIEKIEIDTPTGPLRFTMSIGVSESSDEDRGIEDALSRADTALYEAKEKGRNQVVCI